MQVETRLRQLEGKMLALGSGVARGKASPPKYDPARQGAAGAALLTQPKAYNADADVTADAGKAKKEKKKKVRKPMHGTLALATEKAEDCSRPGRLRCDCSPSRADRLCKSGHSTIVLAVQLSMLLLQSSVDCGLPVQKKGDATAEATGVDSSAAANGAMEMETPATTAAPAVNGAVTAEKKKKMKKRSAEEAAIEAAPTDGANAAEAATATPKKKKKEKAAQNGSAEDAHTTEKKV